MMALGPVTADARAGSSSGLSSAGRKAATATAARHRRHRSHRRPPPLPPLPPQQQRQLGPRLQLPGQSPAHRLRAQHHGRRAAATPPVAPGIGQRVAELFGRAGTLGLRAPGTGRHRDLPGVQPLFRPVFQLRFLGIRAAVPGMAVWLGPAGVRLSLGAILRHVGRAVPVVHAPARRATPVTPPGSTITSRTPATSSGGARPTGCRERTPTCARSSTTWTA